MKKVEILKTAPRPASSNASRPATASPTMAPKIAIKSRPPTNDRAQEQISPEPFQKTMKESVRFLSEVGEITESISDLLTSSPNFNVISAIGPQGAGKSTILSMLAGNNSRQMYREYVFRPVSREANEQSRHQTIQIDIYVTNHHIFLDCQPMHSYSIMESLPKIRGKLDESTAHSDTIRLTAFLLYISHSVLVVSETHYDKAIIDTIRTAELIRPYLAMFRPKLSTNRKTNLLFIQTKASSIDLAPTVIREREELIRLSFQDSKWLRVSDEPFKVLIVSEEIRVRREHLYEEGDEPDDVTLNEYDEQISWLREELQKNREDFSVEPAGIDEKKWLELCREVIRDKTFHKILREYQQCNRSYGDNDSYLSKHDSTFKPL